MTTSDALAKAFAYGIIAAAIILIRALIKPRN